MGGGGEEGRELKRGKAIRRPHAWPKWMSTCVGEARLTAECSFDGQDGAFGSVAQLPVGRVHCPTCCDQDGLRVNTPPLRQDYFICLHR